MDKQLGQDQNSNTSCDISLKHHKPDFKLRAQSAWLLIIIPWQCYWVYFESLSSII
jgi:hypothetical protein